MKKNVRALIGFSVMKDDELMVAATTIVAAMTDNVLFENPSPELEKVQIDMDDFSVKLAQARKRGSPEDTALKDESKAVLAVTLKRLGYYVNSVANGHLPTVLSSGFPTNAPTMRHEVPLPVEGLKLTDGRQSGQVRLDFQSQKNVLLYEYCYRKIEVPEQEWSDRFTTTSSRGNIIAPLEEAQRYEAKARAVNTKGAGDWSQVVSILVR